MCRRRGIHRLLEARCGRHACCRSDSKSGTCRQCGAGTDQSNANAGAGDDTADGIDTAHHSDSDALIGGLQRQFAHASCR